MSTSVKHDDSGFVFVGLTGGIGSGKSTVGAMLRRLGIPVLDADQIARQVVEPGEPAHAAIAAAWPEVITRDRSINRARLAGIAFSDPAARVRLEAIVHPHLKARSRALARKEARAGNQLVFYEASLLFETKRTSEFAAIVVVFLPEEMQLRRAVARGEQSEEQVLARMTAQLPLAEKVRQATHVIDNRGNLEATRRQVEILVEKLRMQFGI